MMKSKVLIIVLALVSSCTPKGGESLSTTQMQEIKDELEKKEYIGAELQSFHADFKHQIKDVIWIDEPPAKLAGVLLKVDDNSLIEIDLVDTPDSVRFNMNLNWTMEKVGMSRIESITLSQGDSIIQKYK